MPYTYSTSKAVSVDAFVDLLKRSELAARRPVDNRECLEAMLKHADILATCHHQDTLVGIARSVTDFSYCCYLSDLAVDATHQRRGVGAKLIAETRSQLAATCQILLLSAPAAVDFYPRIGFQPHEHAWTLPPGTPLNR